MILWRIKGGTGVRKRKSQTGGLLLSLLDGFYLPTDTDTEGMCSG